MSRTLDQPAQDKALILCVDKDDDIGSKAGVETPVIGREANLETASRLALQDPEEADANSIFGAIRLLDTLSKTDHAKDYEVASISGSQYGGVESDLRIGEQLRGVLDKFPARGVIFVTDGFSDETVIPIIQSYVPILSVRRIVVRHSQTIEESAALLSRYAKILIEDPYYAKWALGVPGILLLILGVFWYSSVLLPQIYLPIYGPILVLVVLGLALLVKGFGLDKMSTGLFNSSPPNLIRWFATLAAIVIFGVNLFLTYTKLVSTIGLVDNWLSELSRVVGYSILYSIDLVAVATSTLLIGWAVFFFFVRDHRMWRNIVALVVMFWMREVSIRASMVLTTPFPTSQVMSVMISDLLFVIGLGIAVTIAAVITIVGLSRRFSYYFGGKAPE